MFHESDRWFRRFRENGCISCLYLEEAIIGKTLPFVCRNIKDEGKDSQNCRFLKKVSNPDTQKLVWITLRFLHIWVITHHSAVPWGLNCMLKGFLCKSNFPICYIIFWDESSKVFFCVICEFYWSVFYAIFTAFFCYLWLDWIMLVHIFEGFNFEVSNCIWF